MAKLKHHSNTGPLSFCIFLKTPLRTPLYLLPITDYLQLQSFQVGTLVLSALGGLLLSPRPLCLLIYSDVCFRAKPLPS